MSVSKEGAINLAVDATFELARFVEVAGSGLGWAANAKRITETVAGIRNRTRQNKEPIHPTATELAAAAKLEAFATSQAPHFPFLHSLAAFRLWAILEASVEDFARELLVDHPELRERPEFVRLEGALVPFVTASPDRQADILLTHLEERVSAPLKTGVGRFESLLAACGLGGGVCDSVRRVLLELSEVRNVVAHCNGKADGRLLQRCPWFSARENETILLTFLHFERYVTAAHWYLVELSRRYLQMFPESEPNPEQRLVDKSELLGHLEHRLQKMEDGLAAG
jgi:hypothetical protein